MSMICVDLPEGRFNYRAAAVIYHGSRLLLQRAETDDFWVVPGGRVEFGEDARETLRREMLEEIQVPIEVGNLRIIGECFFENSGMRFHELGLYFDCMFPPDCPLLTQTTFEGIESDLRLIFRWFTPSELHVENVRPYGLVPALAESAPCYCAWRETR